MSQELFEESSSTVIFTKTHRCFNCQQLGLEQCIFVPQVGRRCIQCHTTQVACIVLRCGPAEHFDQQTLKKLDSQTIANTTPMQTGELQTELIKKQSEIDDLKRKLGESLRKSGGKACSKSYSLIATHQSSLMTTNCEQLPQIGYHTLSSLSTCSYDILLRRGTRFIELVNASNSRLFLENLDDYPGIGRQDVKLALSLEHKHLPRFLEELSQWKSDGYFLDILVINSELIMNANERYLLWIAALIRDKTIRQVAVSWVYGGINPIPDSRLPTQPAFHQIMLSSNRRSWEIASRCHQEGLPIQAYILPEDNYKGSTVEEIAVKRSMRSHLVLTQFCIQKSWLVSLPSNALASFDEALKIQLSDFTLDVDEMQRLEAWVRED